MCNYENITSWNMKFSWYSSFITSFSICMTVLLTHFMCHKISQKIDSINQIIRQKLANSNAACWNVSDCTIDEPYKTH